MKQNATLDSSFWINAHRSGLLAYVLERFTLHYAPAVAAELREEFAAGRRFWVLVREGGLIETYPSYDAVMAFGPGERAAINLALEHRDWVLLIDDRRPLMEAQRRGLTTLCTPVLVATLFDEGRLGAQESLRALAELAAMQTVSPALIEAAIAQLGLDWHRREG